jgi:hypothetical protein
MTSDGFPVQPPFIRNGSYLANEAAWPRTLEGTMSEEISRRTAFSMLGLGAALGLTLSAVLEPLEVEAQEAAAPAAAPAEATGTHGMQRRQGRRTHRHERRHGRQEHRHERRTGEKPAAAPAEPPK